MSVTSENIWQRRAAEVDQRIPTGRLHPAAMAFLGGRTAAARGPWAVAFSGGADSLCLLLLMWCRRPDRRRGRLVALHFNHRLRGRAADADERFCRKVCRALGVRFLAGRWDRAPAGANEETAREARFTFFRRAMRAGGLRVLCLGHNQNDVAETLLMRVARGSGTAGLAAPRPLQRLEGRVHVRPLLTVQKEEVVAALRAAGISWREDASNTSEQHFRNRVRRRILPAWQKAAGRDAVAGAGLTRELMEEDDVALETWVDEIRPWGRNRTLLIGRLKGRPRAVVRRALRRWLAGEPRAGDLSRRGFEDLLAAVLSGRPTRRSLGRRVFAVIRKGRLVVETRHRRGSGGGDQGAVASLL